jgi:hypothetical protein
VSDSTLRSALRLALPAFLTGKAVSFLVGWLAVWSGRHAPGFPSFSSLADAFSSWDGDNYRTIAAHGYPPGPLSLRAGAPSHLWGFFPGLPMAVHALAYVLVNVVLSALVVNAVCELVALVFLVRLVQLERGDEEHARTAAWLLALQPYAIFLTVFYTEAPFLAAATAALYWMRRAGPGDHLRACAVGGLATAVRITGLALVLPLLLERLTRRRWRPDWELGLIALVPLPLLLFMLYASARTGDASAYFHIHSDSESYGMRHLTDPWTGLVNTWDAAVNLTAVDNGYVFGLEVFFGVVATVLVAIQWAATCWRWPRIAPSLALYSTGVLLPAICLTFWAGLARYTMTMVPVYILAADLLRARPALRIPVIATSGALMAYGTAILLGGRYLS